MCDLDYHFAVVKMQNVKNFFQGKALGVAEYLTPILKVIFRNHIYEMVFLVKQLFMSDFLAPDPSQP